MELTEKACYQALLSHDRRFDGVFFTCVKTTGIYCRPICPAIVPRQSNCQFVLSAAAAEKAGYRPCLRCRPEYAPASMRSVELSVAQAFARYVDETLLIDETIANAVRRFAVSERHLRRQFASAFGVDPKEYLTTCRLLFAKQLLQDTTMPIIQVAYAAGFNTPGRLTINMREAYGFTPERLRKEGAIASSGELLLRTDYRPPFHFEALLQFLRGRATPHERITEDTYYRQIDGHEVAVTNVAAKNYLVVRIPLELSRQAHMIVQKVRTVFDLDANPRRIETELSHDPFLKRLIALYPGLRVPGCWDDFEMLLRVIVGQHISVVGATTIMDRLVRFIGSTTESIAASTPEAIAKVGMPGKRAMTIWQLGQAIQSGRLRLDERDPRLFYEQLVAMPGIGSWTAEYLRMRVLHWPDAFPAGDLGLQKAVIPGERQTQRQLLERSLQWQPWRSYAVMLLWKSLENKGG